MARRSNESLPKSLADQIGEVGRDREHGASWLARQSAVILAGASLVAEDSEEQGDYSRRLDQLRTAARQLSKLRPSMAAVANTVAHVCEPLHPLPTQGSVDDLRDRLLRVHQRATQVTRAWSTVSGEIFAHVRPLLGTSLYTHSRSGTVEYALTTLAQERPRGTTKIIISQSHPGDEGIGLARKLSETGMEVWLVADSACGVFVGDAEAVIVGADTVRSDGSVVNKVGTLPLALAARESGVPVYVLCETMKIAAPSFPLGFEEMDPNELLPYPVAGVTVRNVYFDLTPSALIGKIISEQGSLTPLDIEDIADRAEQMLTLLSRL